MKITIIFLLFFLSNLFAINSKELQEINTLYYNLDSTTKSKDALLQLEKTFINDNNSQKRLLAYWIFSQNLWVQKQISLDSFVQFQYKILSLSPSNSIQKACYKQILILNKSESLLTTEHIKNILKISSKESNHELFFLLQNYLIKKHKAYKNSSSSLKEISFNDKNKDIIWNKTLQFLQNPNKELSLEIIKSTLETITSKKLHRGYIETMLKIAKAKSQTQLQLEIALVLWYIMQQEFWQGKYFLWTKFNILSQEIKTIAQKLGNNDIVNIVDKRLTQYK